MIVIPQQLHNSEYQARFVKTQEKRAFEEGWNQTTHYSYEEIMYNHLLSHTTYGVICGHKGLVVIDCDNKDVQEELLKIPIFNETFTVKTATKGLYHFYFLTDKEEPDFFECEDKDGKMLVEFRGKRVRKEDGIAVYTQVVGPGSILNSGKEYVVINDKPIAHIEHDLLKEIISKFNQKEKSSDRERTRSGLTSEYDPILEKIKQKYFVKTFLEDIGINTKNNPGECPFHDSVGKKCFSRENHMFRCFHCNFQGSIFDLYCKYYKVSFAEAKRRLAERFNITDKDEVYENYLESKKKEEEKQKKNEHQEKISQEKKKKHDELLQTYLDLPIIKIETEDCFTGDTKIIVEENGIIKYKSFNELKECWKKCLAASYDFDNQKTVFKPITNFAEKGEKPVFEICFSSDYKFKCTNNHRFYCRYTLRNAKFGWKELKEINMNRFWEKHLISVKKVPEGTSTISDELANLIGSYVADGYSGNGKDGNWSISIAGDDEQRTRILHIALNKLGIKYTQSKRKVHASTNILKKQLPKEMLEILNQLGRIGKEKQFPEFVMKLNNESINKILYYYGERDATYKNNHVENYSTVSNKLAEQIKLLLFRLGKHYSSYIQIQNRDDCHRYPIHRICIKNHGREINEFCEKKIVKSIKEVGVENTFDITVMDSHNFILENGIIVHNCDDETIHKFYFSTMTRPIILDSMSMLDARKFRSLYYNKAHILLKPISSEDWSDIINEWTQKCGKREDSTANNTEELLKNHTIDEINTYVVVEDIENSLTARRIYKKPDVTGKAQYFIAKRNLEFIPKTFDVGKGKNISFNKFKNLLNDYIYKEATKFRIGKSTPRFYQIDETKFEGIFIEEEKSGDFGISANVKTAQITENKQEFAIPEEGDE